MALQLLSPAFADNEPISEKYTCKGENVNPPLSVSDVPNGAKSLVLIMHDPDAPVGDYLHWTVWNMSPETLTIAESALPAGALQGTNDFNKIGYGGPCPHAGVHHYLFELYALDIALPLLTGARRQDLLAAMQNHVIDQCTLTGTVSA